MSETQKAPPGRFERLEPYLRPTQAQELQEERRAIEDTLRAPPHVANQIQDRGAMLKQLRSIQTRLHEDSPKAYAETEIDRAARREAELRESFTHGMPTQAEMRRSPAGAIDKHRSWESANKADILEWKNIRLRMHASGMLGSMKDPSDIANIERFRPSGGAQELPMDNTLIAGKQIYFPPGDLHTTNVMSDEDKAHLAEVTRRVMAELEAERQARDKAAVQQQTGPDSKGKSAGTKAA